MTQTTKAQQRAETEALIRKARYGKRKLAITRCPEFDRPSFNRKHGGVVPAYLDPRGM